ncbi:MAG TPA: SUMF1/EgtB/PvdO family nonheme iron enzyme, partial [Planctomycetaceae bacterium]|nr:SUMF1/EgtB/PvdO family nonheme iron enzyme [Planctomycetaceae bacterium]
TVKKDGKNAVYVAIVDGKLAVTPGNQPSLKSAMTQVERTNAGDSLPADGDPQTPSAPDFALQFTLEDGPLQQIEIPIASLDPNLPWTLEGDIQPADITSHNHGLIAIFGEDTWQLRLKHWSLELVEQSGPVQQDRNENIIVTTSMASWRGKCVHVAAVYDGKQAWMFIDGKLISRASPQFLPKRNLGILILGARFNGRMDEWRVSKVARYEKDFTPPKRYESDPDTIALYHFDEGSGDLLRDSSGNDHTGTIQGAKWVTSDKESIGPASNAPASGVVYLDDLPETVWRGYNELGKHGNYLGVNPVKQNGSLVAHSLFTAPSPQDFSAAIEYDLAGQYAMFDATICLLCEPKDPQKFRVLIDDKLLWESIRQSTPNVETAVSVDVRNAQRLRLEVKGLPSYSWPVWLYPRLTPAATSKLDATTPGPPTAKAPFDAQQAHMHQEEYSFGDHSSDLDQHGWHLDNAGFMCHPVAEKKPNSFGLFDIHGNLEEWCGTEFDEVGDAKKTPNVPPKAEHKTFYAVRGGHWYFSTALCRSAFRGDSPPTQRYNTLGFRIAQEIKAVP